MHLLSISRTSLALLAIISVGWGAACSRSPAEHPAPAARVAMPAPAVAGTTPAPGAERFGDDPHPEQVELIQVTKDSLAQGINSYVQDEASRHGGVFAIDDPQQHTSLELSLTAVHRDRLSGLGDGRYFACADFKGRDGHTYDVDVFMRPQSTGGFAPTDVVVHKQDGKPRFDWVEQNGGWSQVPVSTP
jgi:hypothetical protein